MGKFTRIRFFFLVALAIRMMLALRITGGPCKTVFLQSPWVPGG
jgi:hypothetical protein